MRIPFIFIFPLVFVSLSTVGEGRRENSDPSLDAQPLN
jgi:hypothetical protein